MILALFHIDMFLEQIMENSNKLLGQRDLKAVICKAAEIAAFQKAMWSKENLRVDFTRRENYRGGDRSSMPSG